MFSYFTSKSTAISEQLVKFVFSPTILFEKTKSQISKKWDYQGGTKKHSQLPRNGRKYKHSKVLLIERLIKPPGLPTSSSRSWTSWLIFTEVGVKWVRLSGLCLFSISFQYCTVSFTPSAPTCGVHCGKHYSGNNNRMTLTALLKHTSQNLRVAI